jgi:predicted aldo/keto reductase-like oxidoreductase
VRACDLRQRCFFSTAPERRVTDACWVLSPGSRTGNIKGGRHVTFNPVRIDVVKRALEAGVNYFDTTFYEEVQSLGHVLSVLGVDKSSVIINGMSIDVVDRTKNMTHEERVAYIDQELSTRLELLGRDYFDIFMLCGVEKGFRQDVFDDVIAIYRGHQAAGRIRFVGTSGHDHELFLDLVTQGDAPPQDVLMCPWNYAVANNCGGLFPKISQLMNALEERGVGFVGMKNLCWTMYGIPFTCILNQSPSGDDIPGLVKQSIGWMTANGNLRCHGSAHVLTGCSRRI